MHDTAGVPQGAEAAWRPANPVEVSVHDLFPAAALFHHEGGTLEYRPVLVIRGTTHGKARDEPRAGRIQDQILANLAEFSLRASSACSIVTAIKRVVVPGALRATMSMSAEMTVATMA